MKITFQLLILACFVGLLPVNSSAQQLPVPTTIQQQSEWCWSACSKCVLDYYGLPSQTQCSIAEYARTQITWTSFGTTNCCVNASQGCNYWNYSWGYPGSIEDILQHFGGIKTINLSYALSVTQIQKETFYKNPFIIRWGWYSGGGHFMVGSGISGNSVYYMNPLPGYGAQIGNYDWMVDQNNSHTWTHTQLFCAPPAPVSGKVKTCEGSQITYSITGLPDAQYSWTLPAGWVGGSTSQSVMTTAGKTGGMVVLACQDRCGTSTTQSLQVNVTQIDTGIVLAGGTLTSSQAGAQYQWISCAQNLPVAGATLQSFVPKQQGSYAVKVLVDGCENTSACKTIDFTSLTKYTPENNFIVFPNPVQDLLTIRSFQTSSNKIHVQVLSVLGAVLYSFYTDINAGNDLELDVSSLPSGIFHLQINEGATRQVYRLVKQ